MLDKSEIILADCGHSILKSYGIEIHNRIICQLCRNNWKVVKQTTEKEFNEMLNIYSNQILRHKKGY